MSLIKKFFGKKEKALRELRFEDIPGWLEEASVKMDKGLLPYASSIFSEIERSLSSINKSVRSLEGAEPEGRFHLKMVKVTSSNRDNMVRQVKTLIENIVIPENIDAKTIIAFHDNAMQSLTVCLENMLRSYQYTKLVYLDESKQVIADVNALGRLLNRLIEPVNEKKTVISALENTKAGFQDIKKMHLDIEIEKKHQVESEEKINLSNKEIQEKQKRIDEIRKSDAWERHHKDTLELADLDDRARKTESEINALVIPLNKALSRLKQLDDSRRYTLKPELREQLNICLADPRSADHGFFLELEKIIKSDALELTPEKKDRFVEQIIHVLSFFDPLKNKYMLILGEIEKKKKQISEIKIIQEEINLNSEIKVLQGKVVFMEKELELSRNRLSSLEAGIGIEKEKLKKNISAIDSSVTLPF